MHNIFDINYVAFTILQYLDAYELFDFCYSCKSLFDIDEILDVMNESYRKLNYYKKCMYRMANFDGNLEKLKCTLCNSYFIKRVIYEYNMVFNNRRCDVCCKQYCYDCYYDLTYVRCDSCGNGACDDDYYACDHCL